MIGTGYHLESGTWSADSKRVVVETWNPQPAVPEDEHTFSILFTSGSPGYTTRATWVRSMDGLNWLTPNIVIEGNSSCGSCIFRDYYVVETGELLPEISWDDCFPRTMYETQRPVLSPNQYRFVVVRTDQNFIEPLPFDFAYTPFNFNTKHAFELLRSPDTILDFVDWTPDSAQFLLICRLVSATVPLKLDVSSGLLSLNPTTQQLTPIAADVRYAWLSPDRQHFFGRADAKKTMRGVIYALDGARLTPSMPVHVPDPWAAPAAGGPIWMAWSPDSSRVAYRDMALGLWLAGIDGSVLQLAVDLPLPEHWPYDTGMVWSPNSSALLTLGGIWAWLVYPPLIPGQTITLTHIAMVDGATGWGQRTSGHVVSTVDGGKIWTDVPPLNSAVFFYQDGSTAWTASVDGAFTWEIVDSGESWQPGREIQARMRPGWQTWPDKGMWHLFPTAVWAGG